MMLSERLMREIALFNAFEPAHDAALFVFCSDFAYVIPYVTRYNKDVLSNSNELLAENSCK